MTRSVGLSAPVAPHPGGSVLVACPTYDGKAYALDRWIAGVRALTYERRAVYVVDNSRGTNSYMKILRARGLSADRIEPSPGWEQTFKRSWALIYRRAVRDGHAWILSLEADVVPAPEALGRLVSVALVTASETIAAEVPLRPAIAAVTGIPPEVTGGYDLGCTLLSTRLVGAALRAWPETGCWLSALRETSYRVGGLPLELPGAFPVEHLDDMDAEYWSCADPCGPDGYRQPPPAAVWTTPTLRAFLDRGTVWSVAEVAEAVALQAP